MRVALLNAGIVNTIATLPTVTDAETFALATAPLLAMGFDEARPLDDDELCGVGMRLECGVYVVPAPTFTEPGPSVAKMNKADLAALVYQLARAAGINVEP